MRHFTNSTTFDVNYLFNGDNKRETKHHHKDHSFSNEAMFDVKDMMNK